MTTLTLNLILSLLKLSISIPSKRPYVLPYYLTLRLVLSMNNPQNSEMKFCENMKLTC
jgi:hypothetical protein